MAAIQLPEILSARNLPAVLAALAEIHEGRGIPHCDASRVRFLDPLGLCLCAMVWRKVLREGREPVIGGLSAKLGDYMARMNVFEAAGIEWADSRQREDRRATLQEVMRVDAEGRIDEASRGLTGAVLGTIPDVDPQAPPDEMTGFRPGEGLAMCLRYWLDETLANALTHARRCGFGDAAPFVSAQYWATSNRVGLAVVDDGCGLLASLEGHSSVREHTDAAAVAAALLPGVSCNRAVGLNGIETGNLGLGLTVVRDLVQAANGFFYLATGGVLYTQGPRWARFRSIPRWQGTLIYAEMPRAGLEGVRVATIVRRYQPSAEGLVGLNYDD